MERGWRGEQRTNLRGAVNRADGAEVVRLLRDTPLDDDVLQLAGDGLLAALGQGVEGAADLAAAGADALAARGWLGDDELEAELRAAIGDGPQPLLRAAPVDLNELSTHIEGGGWMAEGARLDLETGDVWPAGDVEGLTGEPPPEHWDDPDRWLELWPEGSRDAYRDMALFAEDVDDPHLRELLEVALDGKGAFRRFKDVLARFPEQREAWFAFSEERTRGRARAWLAGHGYRPGPAPARSPDEPPF
jgi:hypothetical protein